MRLLICADGQVGAGALEHLALTHPEDVGAVVVVGDGRSLEIARSYGFPVVVWTNQDQVATELSAMPGFDLGVLAWWPHIIREPLISIPKQGFINFHPSLLPFNRGKHYNFWAIVDGNPFGVSIHRVEAGIDSGAILFQREIPYTWADTGESLFLKAQQAMLDLWRDSYPDLRSHRYTARPQDLHQGSFHLARELEPASLILLDAQYTGRQLINLLRARTFTGKPACRFEEAGRTWEIRIQITEKT
jgi:methionyl-tRNA formyltransferase